MPKTKTFLKKVYQCQATCFVRRDIPPAIHCQYRYKSALTVANACNIFKFQKKQFCYVTFCQLNGSRKSTVKRPLTFAEVSSNSPAIDPQILHQLVGLCNFQNPNDHCESGLVEKANFSRSFTFPSSAIAVCSPSMTLAGSRSFSTSAEYLKQEKSSEEDIQSVKSKNSEEDIQSDNSKNSEEDIQSDKSKTKIEQLKKTFAVYGTFGVVFHIMISLISLGICYLIVESGIDVVGLLNKMGIELSTVAGGASTVVVAYAIHKLILPLRASITIVSVPVVVRRLRKAGYFKK